MSEVSNVSLANNGTILRPGSFPIPNEQLGGIDIHPEASIARPAYLEHRVFIGRAALGPHADLGDRARLEDGVAVGPNVRIGRAAVLKSGAAVYSYAHIGEEARLEEGAIVGSGIWVPSRAIVGPGAVIPTQETLEMVGPVGVWTSPITVHGSENGPLYSAKVNSDAGDVVGQKYDALHETVMESIRSIDPKALRENGEHLAEHFQIALMLGLIVQRHFEQRKGRAESLRQAAPGHYALVKSLA